jgi:hypothetical protein
MIIYLSDCSIGRMPCHTLLQVSVNVPPSGFGALPNP